MEMEQNSEKPSKRTPIWKLDCTSICTMLGIGLSTDELENAVIPRACPCFGSRLAEDRGLLLQAAHQGAHHENEFSREVSHLLDDKFREEVAWVSRASLDTVRERLDSLAAESYELPGILWGLLTDPCEQKLTLGRTVAHACLHRGLSAIRPRCDVSLTDIAPPDSTVPTEDLSVGELRAKVTEQAATIERMLDYISRTRPEGMVIGH
ncbi:hypothetical protein [Kiritimatiella glycovorans]|uniref:Uncharacterized protein n=1 Tax=Kiritimatiella glycovorans TaxID=1307763 RepID=A0A0G3EHF9_9BACT|nr:hypothetical protein [Kiritimatiella glycovorans]AKJ64822.1 hypothetical protein L21SP4_01579 [Kiritimatiella glycovorans]